MNVALLIIDCVSNLLVGSGKDNDGLIDIMIQKDPVTGIPCIFSSSLKGALRQHCSGALSEDIEKQIFGKKVKSGDSSADIPGGYRFTDAMLLAIPDIQNANPYQLVSCKDVVEDLKKEASMLGGGKRMQDEIDSKTGKIAVSVNGETVDLDVKNFLEYFADDDRLPVIARNYLEDGISGNLWYEQVLPRKSRLASFVLYDGEMDPSFVKAVSDSIVQIGANATVGYGLCKISIFTDPAISKIASGK